jgi:hypothetical protein
MLEWKNEEGGGAPHFHPGLRVMDTPHYCPPTSVAVAVSWGRKGRLRYRRG